jgi:Zn-finger nucleic acid-binding protein
VSRGLDEAFVSCPACNHGFRINPESKTLELDECEVCEGWGLCRKYQADAWIAKRAEDLHHEYQRQIRKGSRYGTD